MHLKDLFITFFFFFCHVGHALPIYTAIEVDFSHLADPHQNLSNDFNRFSAKTDGVGQ